jgi:hypothetical protein
MRNVRQFPDLTIAADGAAAGGSCDGKTVEYRSRAEIEALGREIAAAEGRRSVRRLRVTTSRGL